MKIVDSKVTHATNLVGKVVRFEDGTSILLVSGGVGEGCTFTFKRTDEDEFWTEMPMVESLPYVMALMKEMVE